MKVRALNNYKIQIEESLEGWCEVYETVIACLNEEEIEEEIACALQIPLRFIKHYEQYTLTNNLFLFYAMHQINHFSQKYGNKSIQIQNIKQKIDNYVFEELCKIISRNQRRIPHFKVHQQIKKNLSKEFLQTNLKTNLFTVDLYIQFVSISMSTYERSRLK